MVAQISPACGVTEMLHPAIRGCRMSICVLGSQPMVVVRLVDRTAVVVAGLTHEEVRSCPQLTAASLEEAFVEFQNYPDNRMCVAFSADLCMFHVSV